MRGILLCRTLLVLDILVGLPSVWETLSFSWDPPFQAPALRYGPTHSNYHAFAREPEGDRLGAAIRAVGPAGGPAAVQYRVVRCVEPQQPKGGADHG